MAGLDGSAMSLLKSRLQAMRDENEKYRDLFEEKCRETEDEKTKRNIVCNYLLCSSSAVLFLCKQPNVPRWCSIMGPTQLALELGLSHCPNGRLRARPGFWQICLCLELAEFLNTNLVTVRAKLEKTNHLPAITGRTIGCPAG